MEFYPGHKRGFYSTQEESKEGTGKKRGFNGLRETLRFQTWGRVEVHVLQYSLTSLGVEAES